MFLDRLTERQQQSFMALATRMVLADGDVAPEENAILNARKEAMGGNVTAPPAEVFGATNADVLDTRAVRVFVTFEVLMLMLSDDHIHTDETKVMDEICTALKISADERQQLHDLAVRANAGSDTAERQAILAAVEAMAGG